MWAYTQGDDSTLGSSLLGAVKLAKIVDLDKYSYYGYSIGFDACRSFLLFEGNGCGKNAIIFGAAMNLSVYIDNKKEDILVLDKGLDGLDDNVLTAEKNVLYVLLSNRRNFV